MKKVWILAAALAVSMVGTVQAEEIQAKSLAELLQLVKDGKVVNQRINEQREREFVADKNRQQQAVRNAQREQAQASRRAATRAQVEGIERRHGDAVSAVGEARDGNDPTLEGALRAFPYPACAPHTLSHVGPYF